MPLNRYSADTISLLRFGIELARQQLHTQTRAADSPFAENADIYFINAHLAEIQDPDERAALMKIPTELSLTDEHIDLLLHAPAQNFRRSSATLIEQNFEGLAPKRGSFVRFFAWRRFGEGNRSPLCD